MSLRVYVLGILMLIGLSINCALADDEHEVKLIGDKNFNDKTVRYDGIDVSNYQKDINWEATAKDKNIKYVYIKATEGASHKQHRYRRNLENARKHGIKVGSYHFMRTSSSIQSQFNNFISLVKREDQDLVPLLDVETRAGWTIKQLQDSVLKFARMLERHYGCKPMIYTSSSYFNDYLGEKFAGYPLFIARYSKSEPTLNFGAKWILWQFSDRGRIEGIDANVDLSRFNKGCSVADIAFKGRKSKERISSRRDRDDEVPLPPNRRNMEDPVAVPYPNRRSGNLPRTMTKEEREVQERGREVARKRMELERKEQEKQRKEEERLRKEEEKKQKEIEKRWKEAEKRRQAEEKKRLDEEKKRQAEERKRVEEENKRIEKERKRIEQERKRMEQERQRQNDELKEKSRHSAQERMRAEKERNAQNAQEKKNQEEQNRRKELEQAKQERQQREQAQQEQLSAANQSSSTSTGKSKTGKSSGKRVVKGNNQSSADNEAVHYNKKKKNVWNN